MPVPPETAGLLDAVHHASFAYFPEATDRMTGLVADSTIPDTAASIAAVGFGVSALPVAVSRGWMPRADARALALAAVRFFRDAPQDGARDGVGHRGFFYHFLDLETGRRAWKSELSTIDTTFLVAGLLCAAAFFDDPHDAAEAEIRDGADAVYRAVDWEWARDGGETVTMGWTPERGFLRYRWEGYTEALLLYVLAAGSPTHPVPGAAFEASTRGYRWKRIYGHDVLYAGPLFIHQFSHLWVDFRGIHDAAMRAASARLGAPTDYFENSRRATLIHRAYGRRNPRGFAGYSADAWGLTASDGPGPAVQTIGGRRRRFWGYRARGAPFGPDDGTLAPWAALASLPFAPEAVLECLGGLARSHEGRADRFGFEASFNPSFPNGGGPLGWVSDHHFALNQGPIVLAVENHRSGLIWDLMRTRAPLADGLRRCGFEGGWLKGSLRSPGLGTGDWGLGERRPGWSDGVCLGAEADGGGAPRRRGEPVPTDAWAPGRAPTRLTCPLGPRHLGEGRALVPAQPPVPPCPDRPSRVSSSRSISRSTPGGWRGRRPSRRSRRGGARCGRS